MTDRKLMQQALEALQYASDETKPQNLHGCDCLLCTTILALRERLAQPETPYVIDCPRCGHCCPQRPWTGLTEDEIALIVGDCAASHLHDDFSFAREIEGKLREKNT